MDAKITSFIHIGILVENLERAMEYYAQLGFGPFDNIVESGGNGEPADVAGWGIETTKKLGDFHLCRFTKCRNFGVELEIIQPGDEGPYKAWADKEGYGLHHLAICSENNYDNMRQKCIDITNGRKPYIDGIWPQDNGPDIKWTYVDMRPEIGAVVEVCATVTDPEEVSAVVNAK